ncbi:MAG: Lrp/AsnC family transcriptional regulator [Desulfobacterota bacterium]|nr:Lrp/AsnC family transcriptional regulator [Thermodesulfobacteriota bacterium]MDW8001112.1 Lrp/AsnC family transcriptional regulator [Deltaproteobacteria bacterium]
MEDVLRKIPADFPLVKRPYEALAKSIGMEETDLIDALKRLKKEGKLRRVAAILQHRKVSYLYNGMVVWKVKEEEVEEKGKIMASYPEVSHCYEREKAGFWDYNLYTVIHTRNESEFYEKVKEISRATGLYDYKIFLSKREFKKTGLSLKDD